MGPISERPTEQMPISTLGYCRPNRDGPVDERNRTKTRVFPGFSFANGHVQASNLLVDRSEVV